LECLAAQMPFDQGIMRFHGLSLSARQQRRAIAYVPDLIAPWADHSVGHVLNLYRGLYGISLRRCATVIERLTLGPVMALPARELSKGFRRRFLLAIAILAPQPIVLLDEPFDGLDLRQTAAAMELLREVASTRALVLSIHQLTDAERICDRLLLLDAGRCVGFGSLSELRLRAGLTAGSLEEIFLALTQ
jgi:ABC-type multidrug transport system ATPase subunit